MMTTVLVVVAEAAAAVVAAVGGGESSAGHYISRVHLDPKILRYCYDGVYCADPYDDWIVFIKFPRPVIMVYITLSVFRLRNNNIITLRIHLYI